VDGNEKPEREKQYTVLMKLSPGDNTGPVTDDVTKCWQKLRNEALHDSYSSPNIIRIIKSRRMGWAWHIACMKGNIIIYQAW
jgi:hypothetical protein